MRHDTDPAILAELEEEIGYGRSSGKRRWMPYVALDKGQAWLVRFLPAQLHNGNPSTAWYLRFAQHWIGGKPLFCPKHTSIHAGGNPEAYCPICEIVDKLMQEPDETVVGRANKAAAAVKWVALCIVIEKDLGRDKYETPKGADRFVVHQFSMYRTAFEELVTIYKHGLRRSANSILDFETGSNIWLSKAKKGFKLVKEDPEPICGRNEDMQQFIDEVWKTIIPFDVKFLKESELEEAADKLEAYALNDEDTTADNTRSSRDSDGEDDLDRPRSRRHTEEVDGEEEEEQPRSRRHEVHEESARPRTVAKATSHSVNVSAAPVVQQPRVAAPTVVAAISTSPRVQRQDPAPVKESVQDPAEVTQPTLKRIAPPTRSVPPPPARRVAPVPAPQVVAPSPTVAVGANDTDEDDDVAPEVSDPVPPAEEINADDQGEAPPPQVQAEGSNKIKSSIRNRLAMMTERGK